MNTAAIYRRTASGDEPDVDLRLRALEWTVLFNVDDQRNVNEIASALQVQSSHVWDALASLERRGLVEERAVLLSEFLRSPAALDQSDPDAERTLGEFLYREDRSIKPAYTAANELEQPSKQSSPMSVRNASPAAFAPPPLQVSIPFEPLESPLEMKSRAVSLLTLMQYIMSQSRDQTSGQLAVYRVFMGIKTDLLRRNNITSLRFTEDRIVDDPELLSALEASLQRSLGLPFPESAYVELDAL